MTIRARLATLVMAYMLIWFAGAVASFVAVRSWAHALDHRRELFTATRQVARLRLALSDEETGVRGYLLSGTSDFLAPYTSGVKAEGPLLATLRTYTIGADDIAAATRDVSATIDTWRTQSAEPVVSGQRTRSNFTQGDVDEDKTNFDAVRGSLDVLERLFDDGATAASRSANAALRRAGIALATTAAATTALTMVSAFAVGRWVTRPLRSMADIARQEAAGSMGAVTQRAAVEFRDLAAAVDSMQSTITRQRDLAERRRESIEQNALLVTQVRKELETALGEYPPGWTVAASMRAAQGLVAGDCYDVSLIGPSSIALTVIDIAGHGAAEAVAALKCKELLRAALRERQAPGNAITWLYQQQPVDDTFLTVFAAVIDTRTGLCQYANAGHPSPKLVTREGTIHLTLTGPLLGPLPARWGTASIIIEPSSKLVVFTDGVTEARDAERSFYGEARLASIIGAVDCDEAEAVVRAILDDLTAFNSAERLRDDATLVVVCRDDEPVVDRALDYRSARSA